MKSFCAWAATGVALLAAGCDTFHGPGIDYTAPRVQGKLLDEKTGQPIANARVGRRQELLHRAPGAWPKGGSDLLQQHEFVRTDAAGHFELPSERAIQLFRFGDSPLNLDLAAQHHKYGLLETNLPYASLATNHSSGELEVPPVELKIAPK